MVDEWDDEYEWVAVDLDKDISMYFCNGNYYQAKVRYYRYGMPARRYRWTVAFRNEHAGLYTDGECSTLLQAQQLALQHLITAEEAYFFQYSNFMKW